MSALLDDTPIDLVEAERHPALRIGFFPGKGRGLVVGADVLKDELLETAPVVPLRPEEEPARTSIIYDYPFDWPDPPYAEAIALGVISMANHSATPNAYFNIDLPLKLIYLYAARDIAAGEEITIDYGIPLWFDEHK